MYKYSDRKMDIDRSASYASLPGRERQRDQEREEFSSRGRDGPPLRLLALDGGGVKGYSTLLLLQEVMYRLFIELEGRPPNMWEIPRPWEHFDMISGSGTGGLIALMIGRLRMDIETVKEEWVRMSKRVFETDKTIAGVPYRKTLFKASKLESATKDIVKEQTACEEADDTSASPRQLPTRSATLRSQDSKHSGSKDGSFDAEEDPNIKYLAPQTEQLKEPACPLGLRIGHRMGNPDALLYDPRESRCKTFVTAMYQKSPPKTPPCLLRTYLSLTSLTAEPNCKIWEAARATSANLAAFKPIQIGQTVFLDEGAGKYNITPTLLEEACRNEWPERTVGCVLSIGTGKPPPLKGNGGNIWWENVFSTPFDHFMEAKKRLVSKTAAAEDIHLALSQNNGEGLGQWGVDIDTYFRLNVEVGVGEFGMNDWARMAEISTNTKRYLAGNEGRRLVGGCALQLAEGWRARHYTPSPQAPLRSPSYAELQGDQQQLSPIRARRSGDTARRPPASYHIASQLQRSQSQRSNLSLNVLPPPPKEYGRVAMTAPPHDVNGRVLNRPARSMTAPSQALQTQQSLPPQLPRQVSTPNPPYPLD